jgi:hydrogenase maturation protease
MMPMNMKTMVLGLGNPIFGDDGVGLRVIEELKKQIHDKDITVESAELAGLDMLETLSGYDRVIISMPSKRGEEWGTFTISLPLI